MATTKDSATAPPSTQPKAERLRTTARTLALKEATERLNNELLPDEERLLLLDRIRRLRRAVETNAETVDAVHSGLDRL
jgi:hypothetical protein